MVLNIKSSNVSNISRLKSLFYIIRNIPTKYKKKLLFSFFLIFIAGLLEAGTVRYLSIILERLTQIQTYQDIVIPNIGNFSSKANIFCLFAVSSAVLRIFIIKINLNIGASVANYLAGEIFQELVKRDFETSLSEKEDADIDLITFQITKTGALINNALIVLSALLISIFIIFSLSGIGINYIVLLVLVFLIFYGILAFLIKNKLRLNSKLSIEANRYIVKAVQEASCLRSEINMGLNPKLFLEDFNTVDKQGREANALSLFLGILPRYLIEGIILAGGVMMISLLYSQQEALKIIPLIGTLGFAFQKLLPNVQQIFYCWSTLNSQGDSLIEVSKTLKKLKRIKMNSNQLIENYDRKKIKWNNIQIKNISFSYKSKVKNKNQVLSNTNLNIIRGDKIAIYGKSGTGKSTLIKIISGLLKPNLGEICLDNSNINLDIKTMCKLKSLIAYVPQQTQILNKSIIDNLFLTEDNQKNASKKFLKKVIKCCYLEDFINSQPNGISTILGFRGKSISGGQKQRIAICRALLQGKDILIIDEATSSLDIETEEKILDNIQILFNHLTIIHVTHNKKNLLKYKRVIKIDEKKIIEETN